MAQKCNNVLVWGHSLVSRLSRFTKCNERTDPNLGLAQCQVQYIGEGGWKISNLRRLEGELSAGNIRPQLAVVMIGDNDIQPGSTVEEVAEHLVAWATMLSRRYGMVVVISQLMPRYQKPSGKYYWAQYNDRAFAVNKQIAERVQGMQGVKFWYHDFVCFPGENKEKYSRARKFFGPDGVHLSAVGNFRLHRSLQAAVLRAIKRV